MPYQRYEFNDLDEFLSVNDERLLVTSAAAKLLEKHCL